MKHVDSHITDELITSYLEGKELTPEQQVKLGEWINESEENQKYFFSMRETWFSSSVVTGKKKFNEQKAYERFLVRKEKVEQKTTPVFKKKATLFRSVAAAVLFILIVPYITYQKGGEQIKNHFSDVVIEIPFGSKTKLHLLDGSLVWLNAGSEITYSQGFGVTDRKLHLTGEGYFEVIKDSKKPFTVKTTELQVEVLGTKFNFRNYTDDEEATVSLLEGKVWVRNLLPDSKDYILSPNEKVFYNKKTGEAHVSGVVASNSKEWTKGNIFFDEELLVDIVKELERCYNVKITITDSSIESYRFYINLIQSENTIEDFLAILASTGKINYTVDGKMIELTTVK